MPERHLTSGGAEPVKFCCPECRTSVIQPLYWYKSRSHYECKGCGAVILLDDERLTPPAFAHLRRHINLLLPHTLPTAMVLKCLGILCELVRSSSL